MTETTGHRIHRVTAQITQSTSRITDSIDRIEAAHARTRTVITGLRQQVADQENRAARAEAELGDARRVISKVRGIVDTWADVNLDDVTGEDLFQFWEAVMLTVAPAGIPAVSSSSEGGGDDD